MTTKIIRADGVTELTGIKSCTFTEKVNAAENLRPGCVSSAFINVVVYGAQTSAPTAGEALTYYQVDSAGNETLIGTFYAEPSIPSRNTYSFVAYDAVSKLDADFSDWLASNQSNFPMTIYNLVSAACSVAGVTLGSSSWSYSTRNVNAFYADGITCRNILEYAAELACNFVRCNTAGAVVFGWYSANSTGISPGGSSATVAYKQGGLNYENYNTATIDGVSVYPVGQEDAAYTYPSGATGNIVRITGNALLYGANATMMNNNARTIYNGLTGIGPYRPAKVELFPFENPFRAGEIISVTDVQGVSFTTLVMGMTVSEASATIESTGREEETNVQNPAKTVVQLAADIVNIDKAKIGWAEINELFAQNITATGSFQVENGVWNLVQGMTGFDLSSEDTLSALSVENGRLEIRMMRSDGSGAVVRVVNDTDINAPIVYIQAARVEQTPTPHMVFSRIQVSPDGVEISGRIANTIVPAGSGLVSLGEPGARWETVYAKAVNINGYAPVCRRSTTITGTTNSSGNIALNLSVANYGILCVYRSDATSICTPYHPTSVTGWYVHVTTTAGAAVTSTAVTLEVEYYYKTTV